MPFDGRTANEGQSLLPRFQFLPLPEGSYFCSPPNTQRSISGETRVKDKTGSAHMHPRARACATVTYRCNYRIVPLDDRTVDVHIGRLRKALSHGREPNPIRTVRILFLITDFIGNKRCASSDLRRTPGSSEKSGKDPLEAVHCLNGRN